ncbi:hypothetical protein LZ30DRAFT_715816 [Colletotrichum cereale]|nr:hypothetical protein LZ30DRAFT_715816 [Colletotrichum cereale]
MRGFLLLLLAPVAVLSQDDTEFASPDRGELCCDNGAQDPSGHCKGLNLNAYGCINVANNGKAEAGEGGCDPFVDTFGTGRDVVDLVPGGVVKHPFTKNKGNLVGFLACAA